MSTGKSKLGGKGTLPYLFVYWFYDVLIEIFMLFMAVLIEIFMLKFTERPKTPGMTSKKNIAFPEGISRFCANLDETKADMVQFTKRWN